MLSNIYILDGGAYSGGGEAMFQLGCDLISRGYKVSIIDARRDPAVRPPQKFDKYFEYGLTYCSQEDVVDSPSNAVIVPESATEYLFNYKRVKPIIYWLSYENYDGRYSWNEAETYFNRVIQGMRRNVFKMLHFMKNVIRYGKARYPLQNAVNLSGSNYTNMKLANEGAPFLPLFHSIGVDFINAGMCTSKENRKDVILYNPAKPSRLTRKLVKRGKYAYVSIQSMTVDQMIELFRQAKVYIDFGNFPGPERLPKETVFNGVNVLVWNLHAAETDDVLVPQQYKISVNSKVEDVEFLLGEMLRHYQEQNQDFDDFREMIAQLQSEYDLQLDAICHVL
ncbi:hypothetical protein [Bifidobacterium pseudolongum]|nr:hypothetical protein [Bifidobacterium pseudolongum]MCH4835730.1 hypothetical protein [Bifidobacterium pseudolongum]PKU99184.1 UDP-galactopyranose mutase [Bifidobacterium pseudolongum subsp. globosum]RYQ23655.1 UDP-galactopyranose mutase [Bifidobacterium pseudolongum subsp. globosum]